jgi:hypothetical protein
VKSSAGVSALVWPATVTRTCAVPLPGGLVAVQLVLLLHAMVVAALVPKVMLVAPGIMLKPLPWIVTAVPPAAGPWFGVRLVMAGGATYV